MSLIEARPTSRMHLQVLSSRGSRGDRLIGAGVTTLAAAAPVLLPAVVFLLLVDALPAVQR